jgi:xylulokinase
LPGIGGKLMHHRSPDTNPGPASARYVLSIDLGSGGPKAAVVSDTGQVVASAAERIATHLLPHGGAEQDPKEWWSCTKTVAKRAIRASGVAPQDIVAVGCASQYSVTVPVDEQGEPLMNAMHWMDTRGGPYNREICRGFPSIQGYGLLKLIKWIRLTGLAPTQSGIDALGHILFIKNERPKTYEKTHKFLEPMDYLNLRLTGEFTASQHTMAPMFVMDLRRWSSLDYSDDLLKLSGVEKEKLPQLIPNDAIVGPLLPDVADEMGLSPTTQVFAGMNDTTAMAVGGGAVRNFEGIICIGTSTVMTCHLPFKKTDLAHLLASTPSPVADRYLLFAEQGTGGKCLELFLESLVYADDEFATGPLPGDVYDRVDRIAVSVPAGSEGLLFLPWLNGTLTPEENPTARGGFFNLSLGCTRSHMTRAIMEGIAYNNLWTLGPAEKFTGREFDRFRFAGGGALSDVWAQIHADVLDMPIHQLADPTHAAVRGPAFLALDRLGICSLKQLADLVRVKRVYEPDGSNRAVYDRMYEGFRAVFESNKKVFAALNTV